MVFCFNAELAFANTPTRDSILNALQIRIEGKSRFGVDQMEGRANKIGFDGIYVILRFTSQLDQEDIRDRLLTVAIGPNAPLSGSWFRLHDCLHPEKGSCGVGTRTVL